METLADGEQLEVIATDPGFPRDAEAWCRSTGNRVVSSTSAGGKYSVVVAKEDAAAITAGKSGDEKGKTFILFSETLTRRLPLSCLPTAPLRQARK